MGRVKEFYHDEIVRRSKEELDTLPGIGPAYADKIIQSRPYQSYNELKEKSGVAVATIEKIKDLISF